FQLAEEADFDAYFQSQGDGLVGEPGRRSEYTIIDDMDDMNEDEFTAYFDNEPAPSETDPREETDRF
ncbi:MAG: hypothetical protein AAF633_28550, partial [Chloroflexota bacterium]